MSYQDEKGGMGAGSKGVPVRFRLQKKVSPHAKMGLFGCVVQGD